jgi:hypothetical protein
MGAKTKEAKQKKTYVKPQMTRVELTPEEVVLGACKSSGGTGPGGLKLCRLCGIIIAS